VPIIRVDREVYTAIRDHTIDPVLDPFIWQEVGDQEWYEFYVDDEVATVMGDDPNTYLREQLLLDRA
jgi:hypothetical protein